MLPYFSSWKFELFCSLLLSFKAVGWIVSVVFASIGANTTLCVCCVCVPATHCACGSTLSSFPTVFVPWAPCGDVRTEVRANVSLKKVAGFTSCLSGPSWAGSSVERWTGFMTAQWFNLSVSVPVLSLPSLSGDVADAARGGARGFRHSNGGGAQREGVCGEGLLACGEDHCVSTHRYTDTVLFQTRTYMFWHNYIHLKVVARMNSWTDEWIMNNYCFLFKSKYITLTKL